MPKTKKTKELKRDDDVCRPENKRCILIWNRKEYGLTILTMENSKNVEWYEKPVFYIPLRVFMRCGAFWSALHLSTIFWEPKPYHIERPFKETEKIKGAYLIEFAPDLAPICKGWAKQCIDKLHDWPRDPNADEAFVEIVVFQDSLKKEIMDAVQRHELQVSETDKKDIFSVTE